MTDKPRKPRGFEKGGANYKPPGGAGWGGPARGTESRPAFGPENQPAPEAKSAGVSAKAAMLARLEEKRLALAEKLIGLAEGAEAETVQLSAINSIFDRLDGKPAQAVTLGKADPFEGMTADELDAAAAYLRRLGAATGGGVGEAGAAEPE